MNVLAAIKITETPFQSKAGTADFAEVQVNNEEGGRKKDKADKALFVCLGTELNKKPQSKLVLTLAKGFGPYSKYSLAKIADHLGTTRESWINRICCSPKIAIEVQLKIRRKACQVIK